MQEIPRVQGVQRKKCPFYGFNDAGYNSLIDTRGNQCPLKAGFSPCVFEFSGTNPDWNACPFNRLSGVSLEDFENYQVFPNEFTPADNSLWEGISFRDWADYTLNGHQIPIDIKAQVVG